MASGNPRSHFPVPNLLILNTLLDRMVRRRGLEPLCLVGASTSSWCVCQFRHLRNGEPYKYNKTAEAPRLRAGDRTGSRIERVGMESEPVGVAQERAESGFDGRGHHSLAMHIGMQGRPGWHQARVIEERRVQFAVLEVNLADIEDCDEGALPVIDGEPCIDGGIVGGLVGGPPRREDG